MKWFEDFEIQTWKESPALCMRRVGPYGEENHLLMQQFKRWLYEHGLFTANCVIIAAALDNPSHTAPEQCRYDLCFLCNEDTVQKYTREISSKRLAGGRYAVFQILHTSEAVQKAWQEGILYLLKMGYHPDFDSPILERYDKQMVDKHLCELCIPLLP